MSMQLCLVNNNPISTVLITPDGEPLFAIDTPSPSQAVLPPDTHSFQTPKSPTSPTKIRRLERYHMSTGHAETEIGVVEYKGPEQGCLVQLSLPEEHRALAITPYCDTSRSIEAKAKVQSDMKEEEEYIENSWEFTTSDSERYTWKMFAHTPVLISASNSIMPVARYRRAKIGIVSRSRRAFLEIFPAGVAIIDLIVVTFVAFMKQRILIDNTGQPVNDVAPSPLTARTSSTPEVPQMSVYGPNHSYSFSPFSPSRK